MAQNAVTEKREHDASLELLEELWTSSPYEPERAPLVRRAREGLEERLGWILALAWLAYMVSLFAAPAGDPDAVVPLWADTIVAAFFLALGATAVLGVMRAGRSAYVASLASGVLGIALAGACATTDHHGAGWWGYELGATLALTALSVTALRRRA